MSSKSILIILSYTASKFARFFSETQCIIKVRFKSALLRAGRKMQYLLRPGGMLEDYSARSPKTVLNLGIPRIVHCQLTEALVE